MTSAIRRLDPMMSESGVLRVDGRVRNAGGSNEAKLPIILPKNTLPFKPSYVTVAKHVVIQDVNM